MMEAIQMKSAGKQNRSKMSQLFLLQIYKWRHQHAVTSSWIPALLKVIKVCRLGRSIATMAHLPTLVRAAVEREREGKTEPRLAATTTTASNG